MIAKFYYNIARHHGKYGLMVKVWKDEETKFRFINARTYEEMENNKPAMVAKTYKFNTDDGCDIDAQVMELKAKVLKIYPHTSFLN